MAEIQENFANVTNWTNISGTLAAASNQARGSDWGVTIAYHNTALSSTDHYVEATVSRLSSYDGSGLICRRSASGHYYTYFSGTNIIVKRSDESWESSAAHGLGAATSAILRLEIEGTGATVTIRIYINTSLISTATDTTAGRLTSGSNIGVRIDRDNSNLGEYVESLTASPLVEATTALPRRAIDGPFYGSLRGSVR